MRNLLAAAIVLASAYPALAQLTGERVAAIVEEVCVRPTSPGDMMAAGERLAAASGWSFDAKQSGRKQGLLHSVDEAKTTAPVWTTKTWNLGSQGMNAGTLSIWIVGPEYPGQRADTCQVSLPGEIKSEVTSNLRSKLSLGDTTAEFSGMPAWILSGDPTKPDDGIRWLIVNEQKIAMTDRVRVQPYGATLPGQTRIFTMVGVIDMKSQHGAFPPGSLP